MAETEGPYEVHQELWSWISPVLLDETHGELAQPCADPSPPQDVRALVQTLKDAGDPRLTALVLLKLSGVRHATVIQLLTRFRAHNEQKVRWTSIEGLSRIGSKEALAAMLPGLEDADEQVRERAIILLRAADAGVLIGLLEELLASDQPAHREEAARALAGIGAAGFEDQLIGLIDDPNAQVKRLALDLLGAHAGASAADALDAKAAALGGGALADEVKAAAEAVRARHADPLDALASMADGVGLEAGGGDGAPPPAGEEPPDALGDADPFGNLAEVVAQHREDEPAAEGGAEEPPAAEEEGGAPPDEDPFEAIARMKREREERQRKFLEDQAKEDEETEAGGEAPGEAAGPPPGEPAAGEAPIPDFANEPVAAVADELPVDSVGELPAADPHPTPDEPIGELPELEEDPLAALAAGSPLVAGPSPEESVPPSPEESDVSAGLGDLAALAAQVEVLGGPGLPPVEGVDVGELGDLSSPAPSGDPRAGAFDQTGDFSLGPAFEPEPAPGSADVEAAAAALFPAAASSAEEPPPPPPPPPLAEDAPLGEEDPLAGMTVPPQAAPESEPAPPPETSPAPAPAQERKMDLDAADLLAQMAGGNELSLSQLPGAEAQAGGTATMPSARPEDGLEAIVEPAAPVATPEQPEPAPVPAGGEDVFEPELEPGMASAPDLSLSKVIAAPIEAPGAAPPPSMPVVEEPRTPEEWLGDLLEKLVMQGGSDLHLQEGEPPRLRKNDELVDLSPNPVEHGQLQQALSSLVTGEMYAHYLEDGDLDFAHGRRGLARFRCNYLQCGGLPAAVFRVVPNRLPSLAEIGVPDCITDLLDRTSGVILVSGAAGSGKTTTLNALIDMINASRAVHVVSVEDPIEFLHSDKQGAVTQREVGSDTASFSVGVRTASRMDPDVLMLGNVPDAETFKAMLDTSAAGRLVLAAMPARNVEQALENLGALLDPEERLRLLPALASELLAVVSQVLVPGEGDSRKAGFEVLLNNVEAKARIRAGERHWVRPFLQKWRKTGMRTLEESLFALLQKGEIDQRQALLRASEPQDLARLIEEAKKA